MTAEQLVQVLVSRTIAKLIQSKEVTKTTSDDARTKKLAWSPAWIMVEILR
jgi:hypothetical protein